MKGCPLQLLLLQGSALFCLLFASNPTTAQIVPDATLPNNSTVRLQGTTNIIEGGTTAGGNLFHSFQEFSVPTGGAAFFNNALDIQNIFSRVTGSAISNIDGLIGANGTANLFLLNPNGIIFGPNAQLNIGGSFFASTARSLVFADGSFFSAIPAQTTPLLTISVPIGLQYGNNAGNIQVQQSNLQVPNGNILALIGSTVRLDNAILNVPGGRVELGGLAGEGTIGINTDVETGNFASLQFPDDIQKADVSLTNSSEVNVTAGGGGSIGINASNLEILEGSELRAGIAPGVGFIDSQAGDIEINATGTITIANDSFIINSVLPGGTGDAGDIEITTELLVVTGGALLLSTVEKGAFGQGGSVEINTNSLIVTDGAQLLANTRGQGDAGSVKISATDIVSFDGVDSNGFPSAAASSVEKGAVGKGGSVEISTKSLVVTGGARLAASADGQGDAGSVKISATDTVSFDGLGSNGRSSGAFSSVEEEAIGKGGSIEIITKSLAVTGGAQLVASTRGQGYAGSVKIFASDTVSFDRVGSDGDPSVAGSTVEKGAVGKGGGIEITTKSLSVTDGALLTASTRGQGDAGSVKITASDTVSFDGGGAAFSTVEKGAVGNGGSIEITTKSLAVTGGAQLVAGTKGQGDAGSVKITASDTVSLDGGGAAFSSVENGAVGKGGDIEITTKSLAVTGGAQLLAFTRGRGDAGNVKITASDTVSFDGVGSNKLSSVASSSVDEEGAVGNGGSIEITTDSLSVTGGAQLLVLTVGQGDAGSVKITATDIVSFDGVGSNGLPSGAGSTVGEGAVGKAGGIEITTDFLRVTGGALLSASTFGRGDAGSVKITASNTVSFDGVGSDGSSSEATSTVEPGAFGKGGGIEIITNSLRVTDGAQLRASTFGRGNAGSVKITASDFVSFDGVSSNGKTSAAFSTVTEGAVGNGGSIEITTDSFTVTNGAGLAVTSLENGRAGDILINAGSIRLDNRAFLDSATTGGEGNIRLRSQSLQLTRGSEITTNATGGDIGGNIDVQASSLILRQNSRITTNATGTEVKGGNIALDTDVLAALEDSDISANSDNFFGGQIRIDAQSIFGTQFRLAQTPESDITATGGAPELSGTVEINTPDVDPTQGLIELPANLVDASNQFVSACPTGTRYADNEFFITGRGGIPPGPRELLGNNAIGIDWVTPQPQEQSSTRVGEQRSRETSKPPTPTEITEAQGWVIGAKGEVILTAAASTPTPHSSWHRPTDCRLPHSASQR